ncbi:hypothetical protein ANO11243_035520 [Dothideomycetidae sp. 11243]|nr:hypothetical protein ANO11243_035520 [fungal sp. No.11243]
MPHATSPGSSPPAMEDTVMSEAVPNQETEQATLPQSKTNIDDMFDDDESASDDEFSSSAPQKSSQSDAPSIPQTIKASDPDTLLSFYSRLFPFRPLFQWLNAGPNPSQQFTNREFAFVLPNDAYIRYQSFATGDLLRKQCLQMTPVRFEIGPQYSLNPRDRKSVRKQGAFRPVAKELVFDIDMTDYDEIRTCCSKANICPKCWEFMTVAIKVLDRALREDFGFKHLLWVYSGRRGVHCWVSDRRARTMDDSTRKAVAGYMELLRGGGQGQKKVNIRRPLHPHIDRSLSLLNPHFANLLQTQDPFLTPQQSTRLLSLIPDSTLTTALQKKWDSQPSRSSTQKWADIDALASAGNISITPRALADCKQDIRLEYTYPRLDAEVSKKLNHLLKSPFVVHPGTGRVCVPIDPAKPEEFDPFSVPTVQTLLEEIDQWSQENTDPEGRVHDWQKTSLKPYVERFKAFVDVLVKDETADRKRSREDEGGAAAAAAAEGIEF